VNQAQTTAATPDHETLGELLDVSNTLSKLVSDPTASVAEVANQVAKRQALVTRLGENVGPVTPECRSIIEQVIQFGTQVESWCDQRRRETAQRLGQQRRRARSYASAAAPKVVSQFA
jgi:hypothetical protein